MIRATPNDKINKKNVHIFAAIIFIVDIRTKTSMIVADSLILLNSRV